MTNPINESRRHFFKSSLAGGGLLLGVYLSGCDTSESGKILIKNLNKDKIRNSTETFMPNVWLRISTDNVITVQVASSEMGQGVMTSLPMLVAEELDADWQNIQVEFAPTHKAFNNPNHHRQGTGGSQSIRGFWIPLRQAGANARSMLLEAAALTWNVDISDCFTRQGIILNRRNSDSLTYGEVTLLAATLEIPKSVELKKPAEFKTIGKALARLDIPQKTNGSARFGIDTQHENLLVACVAHCPVFGGKVKKYDDTDAKAVPGVHHVTQIDSGIAVLADHFWAAKKARDALKIDWDFGANSKDSSESILSSAKLTLQNPKTVRDNGDVQSAMSNAKRKIEADYFTPFLAHACMEPINCTAYVQADRCDVWVPTQSQSTSQSVAEDITGLDNEKVFVHTTLLGGGFGRRGETDVVSEAVQLSKVSGVPVKVIWTREDDIQQDFYRPISYNKLSAAVNDQGLPIAWQHDIASPSILKRYVPLPKILLRGVDPTATEGASNLPYDIPNFKVRYAMSDTNIPVGFWRSVGNSQNGFITECFLDEVANLGNQDPMELRQRLLKNQPRHLQVLELAAQKAKWGTPSASNLFQGIAVVQSFGSYVAYVAEISIEGKSGSQSVRVHKVVCAVDCGIVVNPDTVKAQIESAVIFGLTAALHGNITINNGRVQQSNFHDYPLLRIDDSPKIEVHLIDSNEEPGGVGEIGVPPIAPAVANAVFAATGQPVRKLPIEINKPT